MQGDQPGAWAGGHEHPVGWHEATGLGLLMVLVVLIGVYPGPIFERLRPSVKVIADRVAAPAEVAPEQTAGRTPPRTVANLAP